MTTAKTTSDLHDVLEMEDIQIGSEEDPLYYIYRIARITPTNFDDGREKTYVEKFSVVPDQGEQLNDSLALPKDEGKVEAIADAIKEVAT